MWTFKETRSIIGKILIDRGLDDTNQSIADLIGVNESNVRYWVKTGNPPADVLIKFAQSLGVSIDFLLGSQNITNEPPLAYAGSQGEYNHAEEVHEEDWNFVRREVQENQQIKIFRVIGDSMAPTLWDGDIIFCYPHLDGEQIRDTHIYVIDSNKHQSLLIKRIETRKDGMLKVYSDNRTEARSFLLNLETDVLSLWRVRTKMTWQLGAPSFNNNLLEEIDKRLSNIENSLK